MKKLVFVFAIMLGVVSCNSNSKVDSTEVTTDTVEFIDSTVEVDSLVEDSI